MTISTPAPHKISKRLTVQGVRRLWWLMPALLLASLLAPLVSAPEAVAAPAPFTVTTFSLGNQVFYDTNNNGLRGTDAGIDGVTVRLLDGSNNVLSTATTAGGGFYRFDNLAAGDYKVEAVIPAGYQSSTDIASSASPNNNTDNDDNGVTVVGNVVRSNAITLGPTANEPTGESPYSASGQGAADSQANMTLDFGFYRLVLGNQVWGDINSDGLLNNGGFGVNGVPVALVNNCGAVVSTTVTSGNGFYTFTGFISGTYVVSITAPSGYKSTAPDAGDPDSDIDDNDDNGVGTGSGDIAGAPGHHDAGVDEQQRQHGHLQRRTNQQPQG